jgi:hypothetical protein
LIVDDEARRMDVLTTNLATGEEALPVFSFEDEARMFLELGALGTDWRVRVTSPGELISVLFCLCANVKRVALDPLPHPDGAALNHLMSIEREAFMEFAGKQGYGAASSSSLTVATYPTSSAPSGSYRPSESSLARVLAKSK